MWSAGTKKRATWQQVVIKDYSKFWSWSLERDTVAAIFQWIRTFKATKATLWSFSGTTSTKNLQRVTSKALLLYGWCTSNTGSKKWSTTETSPWSLTWDGLLMERKSVLFTRMELSSSDQLKERAFGAKNSKSNWSLSSGHLTVVLSFSVHPKVKSTFTTTLVTSNSKLRSDVSKVLKMVSPSLVSNGTIQISKAFHMKTWMKAQTSCALLTDAVECN